MHLARKQIGPILLYAMTTMLSCVSLIWTLAGVAENAHKAVAAAVVSRQ